MSDIHLETTSYQAEIAKDGVWAVNKIVRTYRVHQLFPETQVSRYRNNITSADYAHTLCNMLNGTAETVSKRITSGLGLVVMDANDSPEYIFESPSICMVY